MASATISKELKEAIELMPDKEKNKLLLRLVRKDAMLVQQLEFQLLGSNAERDKMKQYLLDEIERYSFYNDTPGWLMMSIRDFSGAISRYYKITKDKKGEVELLLQVIINAMEKQAKMLEREKRRADKFADYVVKKAVIILTKLDKLHEDLYIEFEDDVNRMLKLIYNYSPTADRAKEQGLPKEFGL